MTARHRERVKPLWDELNSLGALDSRLRPFLTKPEQRRIRRDDGWLDLRCQLKRAAATVDQVCKERTLYDRVIFGERNEEALTLPSIRLSRSLFIGARFTGCELNQANFRGSIFYRCDFRYARLARVSFEECHFAECDFYRACFTEANTFSRAELVHVSFDEAWLLGVMGMDPDTFRHGRAWRRHNARLLAGIENLKREREPVRLEPPEWAPGQSDPESFRAEARVRLPKRFRGSPGSPPALIQEANPLAYNYFLWGTRTDRPDYYMIDGALRDAALKASNTYRALSGMWSAQGQFDDANFAYVRSKALERRYKSLWQRRHGRRYALRDSSEAPSERVSASERFVDSIVMFGSWLWLVVAGLLAKFGEGLGRVVAWVIALGILVPALIYAATGAVRTKAGGAAGIWSSVLFSLDQITSHPSITLQAQDSTVVELGGALQVLAGIILLGLLGFVLGNRLRQS